MIERHWKGTAKFDEADNYVRHLLDHTFAELREIPGFVKGRILRRVVTGGVEFMVITRWESLESIRQFAGTEISTAVVPNAVREMMIGFDHSVSHYEVAYDE